MGVGEQYELEKTGRIEPERRPAKSDLSDLLAEYYCVFVGRPSTSTPYALFSTERQAIIFKVSIRSRFRIRLYRDWENEFDG